MGKYKVEEGGFKVPPEDSYWVDLVWIEEIQGEKGPYYRWHWIVAEVPGQEEHVGARATSQTSLVPTMGNRFGAFLDVLQGEVSVDEQGSTEDLVKRQYRVKAFIEHKNKTYEGKEVTFCNVTKLIEGSTKPGEGVGYHGAWDKLKPSINEWLQKSGQPTLKLDDESSEAGDKAKTSATKPQTSAPKGEMPW